MMCEMCEKPNAELRGVYCGKYIVCSPCFDEAIEARMFLLGRMKE